MPKREDILNNESPYWYNNFNTMLDPQNEVEFQKWIGEQYQKTGRDLSRDLQTYDVRGFWANKATTDPESGHGPDTYKKPNHPTFSDESIYHNTKSPYGWRFQGGKWQDLGNDKWTYTPSMMMLTTTHRDLKQLQNYFDKYETKA